jgi:hypothetical protein
VNGLAQRALGLAAVSLLAAIIPLSLTHRNLGRADARNLPDPVGGGLALTASYGPSKGERRTSCGLVFTKNLPGIAHPVLPCGVKLFLWYQGHKTLTQVVDRGPKVPGRTFDVTVATARALHLHGTQRIHWAYARSPGGA